jgi:hypothetical protein
MQPLWREALERLSRAGFSRAEAREIYEKEGAFSARLKPCPFKTAPCRTFSASSKSVPFQNSRAVEAFPSLSRPRRRFSQSNCSSRKGENADPSTPSRLRRTSLRMTSLAPDKKRPPFSAGAKLPWFSRVSRACLAARRRGGPPGARKRASGEWLRGFWAAPHRFERNLSLGRSGSLGRQAVFHQPDAYAAGLDSGRLAVFVGRVGLVDCIAQRHGVHTVDGNLVFG